MLSRVSYHAVMRYLERVLGCPVPDWLDGKEYLNPRGQAEFACAAAGLSLDEVRRAMLVPAVERVIAGVTGRVSVRCDHVVYVIKDGVVTTIKTAAMQSERHRHTDSKTFSRKESRRLASMQQRRRPKASKARWD